MAFVMNCKYNEFFSSLKKIYIIYFLKYEPIPWPAWACTFFMPIFLQWSNCLREMRKHHQQIRRGKIIIGKITVLINKHPPV